MSCWSCYVQPSSELVIVQCASHLWYIGWSDITESVVTIRSPFYWYNTVWCVVLNGEDLSCYSNKIGSVSLRKCPYDHWLTNKAYLSTVTVTNICQSFTYKMAAKFNWHRYGTIYITVTLCIAVFSLSYVTFVASWCIVCCCFALNYTMCSSSA